MSTSHGRDLLRILRDEGPQTKGSLAQRLETPRTTLSATLLTLTESGALEEGAAEPSSGGRRAKRVQLHGGLRFAVASLGERRLRVAVVGPQLRIIDGVSIEVHVGDEVSAHAARAAQAAADLLGPVAPACLAVAVADIEQSSATEFAEEVANRLGVPRTPALAAVRAMAVGERHAGRTRGLDDFVAVRLGDGVTMAAMVDGRVLNGAAGRAGSIGHLRVEEFGPSCRCGSTGCLDAFAGLPALGERATEVAERGRSPRLAAALAAAGEVTMTDVVDAVRAGDPVVVQLVRDAGRRLGQVLAMLTAALDPRHLVLGGPGAALGEHLVAEVRTALHRNAPLRSVDGVSLTLSEIGERAVLIGAAHAAVDHWIAATAALPETFDVNQHK